MALKLNERYPGRFSNPTAGYPQGSFKNRTAPDARDGSYLEKDWANDKEGFFQSLLSEAGLVASGAVDSVGASQYYDAMVQVIADNIPQATESVLGGSKVSTQMQVNAGSDDATLVTPKKLAESNRSQASMAFTTTGTGAAYLMSPVPTVTALAANQRYTVKFHASSTVTPTINISSLGAKRLKQYTSAGAKVDATLVAGQISDVIYDGTDLVVMNQLPPAGLVQATETVLGGAEIATQPETNAGTDDATIVTPKKLRFGFTFSFGTNGYFFLPSWLMGFGLQWGEVPNVTADATQAVSFPVSFPTEVFGMLANLKTGTAGTQPTSVYSIATSVSGGQVARDTTTSPYATGPIFWVAFGR